MIDQPTIDRILDAVQIVASGGRVLKPADQPDQGGLACAVFAYKSVDCPFGDTHGQAV